MKDIDRRHKEPIAVVGIGCRFPGDNNSAKQFWETLVNGKDCIENIPPERWNAEVFYDPDSTKSGSIINRQGGFIKNIDSFDSDFFGFFTEEAAQLDPQQRMLLEVTYEALEDAGETLSAIYNKPISVFIAGFLYDYLCVQAASFQRNIINPYAAMGINVGALANRISYCFNLNGPSVTIDTACSGSLVALHLACKSIWNGEATAAIAGGVNALLRPESSIIMSKAGFLSPDARCKAFDSSANGYVRSEGCGIVYLKPFSKAIEDNDDIYCIIHGSAVNQDGHTSAGFTVPNPNAQISMLHAAYNDASINPADVDYIETHGPGTVVGDPIEASALGEVIGKSRRNAEEKLLIGSVKTNIGHLEGASGVAGFIKASLALKNRCVPRNLHFKTPNLNIDFEGLKLKVPQENHQLKETEEGKEPIAGVNSFGAGGTNAHIVIQAVELNPIELKYELPDNQIIFTIGAKNFSALEALAKNYILYLEAQKISYQNCVLFHASKKPTFQILDGFLPIKTAYIRYGNKLYYAYVEQNKWNLIDIRIERPSKLEEFDSKVMKKNISINEFQVLSSKDLNTIAAIVGYTPLQLISLAQFTRRNRYDHELFIAGKTIEDFEKSLTSFINKNQDDRAMCLIQEKNYSAKTALIFSGQGGQWPQMGLDLMKSSLPFREALERFDKAFIAIAGWSIIEEIQKNQEESRIDETTIAQPTIVAIQIALTHLLRDYGVKIEGVAGHSIGEVSAAYAVGAITLEQAAGIIYHRAKIQNKATNKGRMLAVGLSHEDANKLIEDNNQSVSIATINAPRLVTLSGDAEPLELIAKQLESRGVFNRFLNVKVAYHSNQMDPLKSELIETLGMYPAQPSTLPLYSTVTTELLLPQNITGEYWFQNVRKPVLFTKTIENMFRDDYQVFIEVGPHPLLVRGIKELAESHEKKIVVSSLLNRQQPQNVHYFFQAIFSWLSIGNNISKETRKSPPVKLPAYPWQGKKYWYESIEAQEQRTSSQAYPFYKQKNSFVSNNDLQFWEVGLGIDNSPYLADHKIDGLIVYPATAHIMLAFAAASDLHESNDFFLSNVKFENALILPDKKNQNLNIRFEISSHDGNYNIFAKNENISDVLWKEHSSGKINLSPDNLQYRIPNINKIKDNFEEEDRMDAREFYTTVKNAGLSYGKTFQCIKEMWCNEDGVLARLELHDSLIDETKRFLIHPSIYDAHLQLAYAYQHKIRGANGRVYLPYQIDKVKIHGPVSKTAWVYFNCFHCDETWMCGDHWLYDDELNIVSELYGNRMFINDAAGEDAEREEAYNDCYEYFWKKSKVSYEDDLNCLIESDPQPFWIITENKDRLASNLRVQLNASRPGSAVHLISINEFIATSFNGLCSDKKSSIIYVPAVSRNFKIGGNDLRKTFLEIMQKIATLGGVINFYILTTMANKIATTDSEINIDHASLYAMARVFMNEYPDIITKVIDIARAENYHYICKELLYKCGEINEVEIAIRENRRYVRELSYVDKNESLAKSTQVLPSQGSYYNAYIPQSRNLNEIQFRRMEKYKLQDNEVRIIVKASAVNLEDVESSKLKVNIGNTFGSEISGYICEVGKEVSDLAVNDSVIARVSAGFSGNCIVSRDMVASKPIFLSFEEAASIPVTYVKAYYSLCVLSKLKKEHKILIHSASENEGIAAIQIARAVGAEIIVTALTKIKRSFLKKEFQIKHVFDSDPAVYYGKVMKVTGNKGVDIVFNINGESATQSLKCLDSFGCYLELGKNHSFSMEKLTKNITYYHVDFNQLLKEKPKLYRSLLQETLTFIEDYKLLLKPMLIYPMSDIKKAFNQILRDSHVGNIILSTNSDSVTTYASAKIDLSGVEGAIIITGGTSGFGLVLAEFMASRGAKTLILISRGGCKNNHDLRRIKRLVSDGVDVQIKKLDVSNINSVKKVIKKIHSTFSCIHGIIHAAGILDGSLIPNMSKDRFDVAFNPKAVGAWNLHLACNDLGINPKIFLMLSSISSTFGIPGTISYATANYFEEALAEYRRAQGLNALTISLGILGDYAGMSKKGQDSLEMLERLEHEGFRQMLKSEVLAKIEATILEQPIQRIIAKVSWRNLDGVLTNFEKDARFRTVLQESQSKENNNTRQINKELREILLSQDRSTQITTINTALTNVISELTGKPVDQISFTDSIDKYALDSIMLGQISIWILRNLEINYPLMRLVKGPSLQEISQELASFLEFGFFRN